MPALDVAVMNIFQLSQRDDARTPSGLFGWLDRWLARWLHHPEDAFVVRHIGLLMATCALGAYANFHFSWTLAAIFWIGLVANGEAAGRFLHMTCHRRVFRRKVDWLNTVPTWLASSFFGEPPFLFGTEHVANHHFNDNGPGDIGCTLGYQRDSWRDALRYLWHYFCGRSGVFGLVGRMRSEPYRRWRVRFVLGQVLFWSLVAMRLWQAWLPTLVLLLAPYFFAQSIDRINNFTEHAFIDPARPHDPLGNSFTIIDSPYNTGVGFNEGYHATHHLTPGIPNHLWPQYFRDRIAEYSEKDHLVFRGLDTNRIFEMLMRHDYDRLARHYVAWPDRPRTHDQIVTMLRERVARHPVSSRKDV
jgi:fatty acid desaturase